MLKSVLLVASGSFIGGGLRYLLSTLMGNVCGKSFPWGTLAVNLVGCLVFGVLFALFAKNGSSGSQWCLLLTTGVCGGFTTFSTFANDSVQMLAGGNFLGFMIYVAMSLVAGVSLLAFGYWLVK